MSGLDKAIAAYATKGILVDANILLLWFVGRTDPRLIPGFKRTSQFVVEDFALLQLLLQKFSMVVATPHILTETSNLGRQLREPARGRFGEIMAATAKEMHETFTPCSTLAAGVTFRLLGLPDASVEHAARGQFLVLTDDFRLAARLAQQSVDVVNFNHIRVHAWK